MAGVIIIIIIVVIVVIIRVEMMVVVKGRPAQNFRQHIYLNLSMDKSPGKVPFALWSSQVSTQSPGQRDWKVCQKTLHGAKSSPLMATHLW